MNAEELVQIISQQVDAYNSHDLKSFVSFYSSDVHVFSQPGGELVLKGIDDLTKYYKNLFSCSPELHAKILNREVKENKIIDEELVTGREGRSEELRVQVEYTFNNDLKICKVIFNVV